MTHKLVRLEVSLAACACGAEFRITRTKATPTDAAMKDALLDAFNTHYEAKRDAGQARRESR